MPNLATNFSSEVSFKNIKEANKQLYEYSEVLYNTKGNVDEIKNLFHRIYNDGLSTLDSYNYSIELIEIFENFEGDINNFSTEILKYRNKVNNDSNIDNELRINLNHAIDVAEYSHEYWYEIKKISFPNNSTNDSEYSTKRWKKRAVIIACGDTAGALTGIQSGLVGYANLVFPGWGGVVALAATAAVGSMNAAGILR